MSLMSSFSSPAIFAKEGECELNATNFPFLVHAFVANTARLTKSDGTTYGLDSNNKKLTCAISDVVISSSTAFVVPEAGKFRSSGTITKTAGNWGTLGTKNALVITTGSITDIDTPIFRIGNTNAGPGIVIYGRATTNGVKTGLRIASNYATGADTTGVTPLFLMAILITNHPSGTGNGTSTTYSVTDANVTADAATITGDIAETWGAYANATTDVAVASSASNSLSGVFVCHFTTTPTNIVTALAWMAKNPGHMYPGWKGYNI
jgi:hypothetical protein